MDEPESLSDELAQLLREEMDQHSIASHEATTAKRILTKLRPDISLEEIRKGLPDGKLNLRVLNEVMPSFPLRLYASAVPYLHTISVATFLNGNLAQTSIFRKYMDIVDRDGLDLKTEFVGLSVIWPDATTVVLHNWPHKDETVDRQKSFGRFVFVYNRNKQPLMFTLEPIDTLIEIIKTAGLCQS